MWHGDVADYWLVDSLVEWESRHVALFGQVIGCHVAQSWAATWHPGIGYCLFVKIYWSPWGSTPGPPHRISLHKVRPTNGPPVMPCYVYEFIVFEFKFVCLAGGRAGA
jgi:hypothetical protein